MAKNGISDNMTEALAGLVMVVVIVTGIVYWLKNLPY